MFDIHEIITKLYNVYLNTFISNYYQEKEWMREWTGGQMDVVRKITHPFKKYCDFLEDFRKKIFWVYGRRKLGVNELKKALSPLVDFYIEVFMFGYIQRDNLQHELLHPLRNFFQEIDRKMNENFFVNKIQSIQNDLHTFKIRLVPKFGSSHTNLPVIIKILKLTEQLLPFSISKNYLIFLLEDDKTGEIDVRVPQGIYRIEIPRWYYRKKIKIDRDKEISIFEAHAKWVRNVKLFSGLFLPFLAGILMLIFFFTISGISLRDNIFLSSIDSYLFPLTNIMSFVAWIISGFVGASLFKKFVYPFLITYLLCWLNFIFIMKSKISTIGLKIGFFMGFSLFSIIINTLIAFLAFIIGGLMVKIGDKYV